MCLPSLSLLRWCAVLGVILVLPRSSISSSSSTPSFLPLEDDDVEAEEGLMKSIYGNTTLEPLSRQVLFDNGEEGGGDGMSKNYRRYYGSRRRDDRGHGSGASAFAFAGSGGGGWGSTGQGGGWGHGGGGWGSVGSEGGYGNGKGWGHKGHKGHNKHYNPSVNKYGGGGPISSFVPGKGGGGSLGTAFSSASAGADAGGGGAGGGGVLVPETVVNIVICDAEDTCQKFVHCASHSFTYLRAQDRCCFLPQQQQHKGMCCTGIQKEGGGGKPFSAYPTDKVAVPDLSQASLETAAKKGYAYKDKYAHIEDRLLELNVVVERGTPAYGHLQFFQTTPEAIRAAKDNFLVIKACNYIQDSYFLTSDEAGIGLQGYDFGGTVFESTCPAVPACEVEHAKYRTHDGTCNNPTSPRLGSSFTPLLRLLPPDYADGLWAPRVRKDGTPLPSARFISRSLVPDVNMPDPRYSHLVMQFGQFIDHDLSHVPIFRLAGDSSGINCCGGANVPNDLTHPACFPIDIPPGDSYIQGDCMNFVRSMIGPRIDCTFGHADQVNQLTHWLDGSQIYGNTLEQAEVLRQFSGGLLKVTRDANGRQLLPEDAADDGCEKAGNNNNAGSHCFVAGDKRVNENIALTSIQTIFLREHNRIAHKLGHLNPHWEDEVIYQETRRIVVAEYQHIVYNEWLPIIIGRSYMETFGILPLLHGGYYKGYDSAIDASISNAFTTAAFRMGHSLVQGYFSLQDGGGNTVGRLALREFFNNPHLLRQPGVIDLLNKGLLMQPIQRFDSYVTTELRDHLFETSGQGMDLVALNIQRGRDHGLPSYNNYRDLCRLGKARDFASLAPIIHPRKVTHLEQIYGSVDDIDLFIGGIHETPLQGAVVGPTFACIIGDQFVRLKRGDKFFYDHGGHPHSFSKDQLHSIRKASMARILCDNSDEIRAVQPLAFHLPHNGYNPILPCGSPSIPHVDLRPWIE